LQDVGPSRKGNHAKIEVPNDPSDLSEEEEEGEFDEDDPYAPQDPDAVSEGSVEFSPNSQSLAL
jgi:hypothetical protein